MNIAVRLIAFFAMVFVLVGISRMQNSDPIQIRQYEVSGVFHSGGVNEGNRKLYGFYRAALESGKDDLFRRTFEKAGIDFPDGTSAIFSPGVTYLYIKHHVSVLDTIERDYSIRGYPYRPSSRLRWFIEDMLERIGISDADPFRAGFERFVQGKSARTTLLPFWVG